MSHPGAYRHQCWFMSDHITYYVHPSVRSCVCPTTYPSVFPSTHSSVCSSIHPSVLPSTYPSFCPSTHPYFRLSTHPSFLPPTLPSVFSSIHPSFFLSIHPSVCPSLHPSIQNIHSPGMAIALIRMQHRELDALKLGCSMTTWEWFFKPEALNYFIRGVAMKVCVFPTTYDTTSSFVSFCSSRVSCFLCVLPPSIDGLFVLLTIVRVESLERVSQLL